MNLRDSIFLTVNTLASPEAQQTALSRIDLSKQQKIFISSLWSLFLFSSQETEKRDKGLLESPSPTRCLKDNRKLCTSINVLRNFYPLKTSLLLKLVSFKFITQTHKHTHTNTHTHKPCGHKEAYIINVHTHTYTQTIYPK